MGGWTARLSRIDTSENISATEHALAESNERYRSLFAYSPHAAFSLDLDGSFTDANEVAQQLSGYCLEELRRVDFAHLIVPEHREQASAAFEGALSRVPQQLEANMRCKDGRLMELNLAAVPVIVGGRVVGVHGTAEDVTERNEMRRELERTRRTAEDASAAKSLFVANMSHEVRTPLTSVLGATELLAEGDLDPRQQQLVAIIHRSGERLLRLVNDILDVSRLEAGRVELEKAPFSLHALVDDATAWASPMAASEGLDFTCLVDPAVPDRVCGDAMRIAQVVTNLLGNAFKFTDEGQVCLGLDVVETRRSSVRLRFRVTDSGIGIDGHQLAALFDSFMQVDNSTTRKYGGAGLGLAISQELASLMGGSISATSTPGAGSVFTFTFPLAIETQA